MQSMGRLMDWTLEDNNMVVDGLFFCATLTGHREGHTPFVQARVETSDTSVEAIQPDPGSSWEGHSKGLDAGVGDENAESCGVVCPLPAQKIHTAAWSEASPTANVRNLLSPDALQTNAKIYESTKCRCGKTVNELGLHVLS